MTRKARSSAWSQKNLSSSCWYSFFEETCSCTLFFHDNDFKIMYPISSNKYRHILLNFKCLVGSRGHLFLNLDKNPNFRQNWYLNSPSPTCAMHCGSCSYKHVNIATSTYSQCIALVIHIRGALRDLVSFVQF